MPTEQEKHDELVELLENVLQSQGAVLIVLQRLYDAYMMKWRSEDTPRADAVLDNHKHDTYLTPLPFITEEDLNDQHS